MQFIILGLLLLSGYSFGQKAYEEAVGSASDWQSKVSALLQTTAQNKATAKALFIGDSITEGWKWSPDWGSEVWAKYYANRSAFNYGIGGDNTANVLYRINHAEFDGLTPKVIVLMIGTNNIGSYPDADTITAIQTIVSSLKKKMSSAKIILMGILPREGNYQDTAVQTINKGIAGTSGVTYIDLGSKFRTSLGVINSALYRDDHLHISAAGYQAWHDGIETTFAADLA